MTDELVGKARLCPCEVCPSRKDPKGVNATITASPCPALPQHGRFFDVTLTGWMGCLVLSEYPLPSLRKGPCAFCVLQLGSVACSPVDCPISCTYPFHPDGECCPVCRGEWDQLPCT
jgi:hypothetical protein